MTNFLVPVTVDVLPKISDLKGKQGMFILPDGSININRQNGTWVIINKKSDHAGVLKPTDIPVVHPGDAKWYWARAGTYTNAGGVIIENFGIISYSGTKWEKNELEIPAGSEYLDLVDSGLPNNLFNINSTGIQLGKAINSAFNLGDFAGFKLSHWIPAEPNTQYTWLKYGIGGRHMQFTKADKTKVASSPGGATVGIQGGTPNVRFTFTTPSDCFGVYYNCMSNGEAQIPPQLMLVKGNGLKSDGITELDFIPFGNSSSNSVIVAQSGLTLIADNLKEGAKMGGNLIATVNILPAFVQPIPPNFMTIVASGTSITNGVGSDGGFGVDLSRTWRFILQTTLRNVLGRSINIINGGGNGQNTTAMRNAFPALLTGVSGQVVIIEGAINDCQTSGAGIPVATTIDNLTSMVDTAISTGNVPILTTPMPIDIAASGMGVYTNQKRCDLAFAVRRIAKAKNVRLIDFDSLANNDYSLMMDGLHPNPKGYLFMANALSSVFV
ncbi:SGNH/GDSL hydrolase family protein [Chryseobacterium vrystaatense]|uniref:SGNH hydrolase-type esterase domain-containing protein n=1 Tax=Chryseobacterium vrystaatense TaxID=307480 RepID=A0ABR4UJ24_9FLAO|nr:SGNH/GDSL hydrolase family protein [Chryseobacterium vrystaatense]KFF24746.1 hypothetical protein IW16_17580 [Chryseobacterium vrystaatense]